MLMDGGETTYYEPDEFLERINRELHDSGFSGAQYTREFDLIIEGSCSDLVDRPGNLEKFIGFLKKQFEEKPAKRVLIFATCCGSYSARVGEEVGKAFPDVEINFVRTGDLYNGLAGWMVAGRFNPERTMELVASLTMQGYVTTE